jgi:hypothetical protein
MTELHDRPTAAELVAAVREFLERDVAPALADDAGAVAFHLKVASRVLAMVEREVELGPAQEAAHRNRLATLGFAGDADLAAAIRAGELDDRYDEVKAAVWAAVRDKLAVANPRYSDEPADQ